MFSIYCATFLCRKGERKHLYLLTFLKKLWRATQEFNELVTCWGNGGN